MGIEYGTGHAARLKEREAQQHRVAHARPDGIAHITVQGNVLHQYRVDGNTYNDKERLEAQGKQAAQVVLTHLAPLVVHHYKEINHGNLITLADFYGVSVDYLLCRTENREQINTPLTELHLNDEMVALLKSGRINNRLLCELATHKDFIKFLADIEIYVDGIATMQIQNLNALVDTVRHEIIERYRPSEDDPHLKVLQAAHISDDEYFSQMVRDDLNLIIRDIREAHKKDSESAPQTTVANELKENLEAVENFKGSRDEKLVVLYCKQLGINYKNLSDEEFRWLIRILKKSKKMGTPISQRKKR